MTPEGANWVRKSLDPFHDFVVKVDGMPDESTANVVVQEITQSVNISAPAGVTSNWDCHIFTLPEMTDPSCYLGALPPTYFEYVLNRGSTGTVGYNSAAVQPATGGYPWGLLNWVTSDPGGPTTPVSGIPFTAHGGANVMSFQPWMNGQKRLIALGFEVHDTTADLYKQGSVVVYRMPQTISPASYLAQTDTIAIPVTGQNIIDNVYQSRLPPATQAEALLLPGSAQWESREGAYCVATMQPELNSITGYTEGGRIFTRGDIALATGTDLVLSTPVRALNGSKPNMDFAVPCQLRPTPFHTSGAYFSGLNVQSTLTLTVRLLFESAPTPENQQLVVLAHPSPDYDPVAIEVYKSASQQLLPGCKVSMNASGDFWDTILDIIADVAPVIGQVIPIPGGGALGQLTAKTAKTVQASRNKASERKQVSPGFSDSPGGKNAAKGAKNQSAGSQQNG